MVTAEGNLHHLGSSESIAFSDNHLFDLAHSQNTTVWRIDDGSEFVNVHHAQVGDGKSIAAEVRRLNFLVSGLVVQFF